MSADELGHVGNGWSVSVWFADDGDVGDDAISAIPNASVVDVILFAYAQ